MRRRRWSAARRRRWGPWSASVLALALVAGWGGNAVAGVERAPVKQLPPGLVILAQPQTPQGVIKIGLHRIRFVGKVRLCLNEADQPRFPSGGSETCATYPIGPGNRGDGNVSGPLFLGPVEGGLCPRKQFLLVAGVVLRPGLVGWVRANGVLTRMQTAAVPSAFGVSGPLIYAVVRGWPSMTLELRDSHGTEVSHVALSGGGDCHT